MPSQGKTKSGTDANTSQASAAASHQEMINRMSQQEYEDYMLGHAPNPVSYYGSSDEDDDDRQKNAAQRADWDKAEREWYAAHQSEIARYRQSKLSENPSAWASLNGVRPELDYAASSGASNNQVTWHTSGAGSSSRSVDTRGHEPATSGRKSRGQGKEPSMLSRANHSRTWP